MLRAVAILALVVSAVRSSPSPQQPLKEVQPTANADSDRNKQNTAPLAVYNQTEPVIKNDAAKQQAQHPDENRSQRIVEVSAAVQAVSALVLLLLTGWLISHNRRALEAYERPWVKAAFAIDDVDLDWSDDGTFTLRFKCALLNIGKSVATDVQAIGELIAPSLGDGSTARKFIKSVQQPPFDGRALFPDDPETVVIHALMNRDDAARSVVRIGNSEFANLRFVGVVFYRVPNSKYWHRTGVVYNVRLGDEHSDFRFILGERLDYFAD